MPTFPSKRVRPSKATTLGDKIGATYRAHLSRHPFLLFGLPFVAVIVGASFVLTPATALRYEQHDRKVVQMDQQEAMSLGIKGAGENGETKAKMNPRRRILGSEKEEYYKLMAKDLDNWEQKRIERFKGEPDGRL